MIIFLLLVIIVVVILTNIKMGILISSLKSVIGSGNEDTKVILTRQLEFLESLDKTINSDNSKVKELLSLQIAEIRSLRGSLLSGFEQSLESPLVDTQTEAVLKSLDSTIPEEIGEPSSLLDETFSSPESSLFGFIAKEGSFSGSPVLFVPKEKVSLERPFSYRKRSSLIDSALTSSTPVESLEAQTSLANNDSDYSLLYPSSNPEISDQSDGVPVLAADEKSSEMPQDIPYDMSQTPGKTL
jgi:hypothetical protein